MSLHYDERLCLTTTTLVQDGKSLRDQTCTNCGTVVPPNGQPNDGPVSPVSPPMRATFLVGEHNREEVKAMDDDIAIVSPLIDGRLKDISAHKDEEAHGE